MSGAKGIVFVRHAMPVATRGLSSKLWPLSEEGREDCVLLAHALPGRLAPVVYSSGETKVRETAAVIALRRGLQVVTDEGFGEVDRPETWDEDYRHVAARYLASGNEPGWEPKEAVLERFATAVELALRAHGEGDVVVVSHGMSMSLYLESVAGVEVVAFWRKLAFPDAWRFERGSGHLERIFSAGLPPE